MVSAALKKKRFSFVNKVKNSESLSSSGSTERSVRIGSHAEVGLKHPERSEDRITVGTPVAVDELRETVLTGYCAVFDGHGGSDCAEYVNKKMLKIIAAAFKTEEDWARGEAILERLFEDLDTEFCKLATDKEDTSGACGTVIVVRNDEALVANIGDCRAVQCSKQGKVIRAITDHRAGSSYESKRINEAGGVIRHGRVHSLEPSRTFGDIDVKTKAGSDVIIARPDVDRFDFSSEKGGFVIVASDGLWDQVPNATAAKQCKKYLGSKQDPSNAARQLVNYAQGLGSSDDITVAVLVF